MRVCVKYGNHTLAEDAAVGSTVLTIEATDADDPDTGSSYIMFNISEGNEGEVFTVETDGKGVGYVVITKVELWNIFRITVCQCNKLKIIKEKKSIISFYHEYLNMQNALYQLLQPQKPWLEFNWTF